MFLIPLGLEGTDLYDTFFLFIDLKNEIHLVETIYSICLLSPTFTNMDGKILDKTLILVFIFPL